MLVILEMMEEILKIYNKVNIHVAHFLVKMISHMLHKIKTRFRRVGLGNIGAYRGRRQRMTPYNEDSFSASFESMSIGTQFRDSSNEGNIYPP